MQTGCRAADTLNRRKGSPLEVDVDCAALMERIATQMGREVSLMCDPSQLAPLTDRWIAHVGALVFGRGATAEEALTDLLREVGGAKWAAESVQA